VRRERVSEDIYVFSSEEYAEVTSGAILTGQGPILIDTLPFPHENRQVRSFLEGVAEGPVRYVINTHFHSDHVYGNYLFPEAEVVAQERCRAELKERGEASLREDKARHPALAEVELRLPTITFEDEMTIYLGEASLRLMARPGEMRLEAIVQGHGEVILRGEIRETLRRHVFYLEDIHRRVKELVIAGASAEGLGRIRLEDYRMEPRLVLGGLAQELHRANLLKLYDSLQAKAEQG